MQKIDAHEERFCMKCGGDLVDRLLDNRTRKVCSRCGRICYKSPTLAAAAIILLDGKLVMVKRGVDPDKGKWCLPSGFEEYEESPLEAVVRETKEETNLDVRIVKLHKVIFTTHFPQQHLVVCFFLCEPMGGELLAGDDAQEAGAFPLDDLPKDIAFSTHIEVIADLLEGRI